MADAPKSGNATDDVWMAARHRLQESQIWFQFPSTRPNSNAWKEALEFHKKT